MRYPIFVEHLIKLARSLGVEQQDIARRLKVPDSSVSLWATGTRPVPRRHLRGFMAMIDELIEAHEATHREDLNARLLDWCLELYVRAGAIATNIQRDLQTLRSMDTQDDIMKLTREDRKRLRFVCQCLVQNLDRLDQFERGDLEKPAASKETPAARFARFRDWYGVDEAEE